MCTYSSHCSLYHSGVVLAFIFIFVILIVPVVKKLNDFSFCLDFRLFFGLQLIHSNLRQYCQFTRDFFPTFLFITIHCIFLPAFVLFLNNIFAFECYSVAYLFSLINFHFESV